jgi:hypothetical protein
LHLQQRSLHLSGSRSEERSILPVVAFCGIQQVIIKADRVICLRHLCWLAEVHELPVIICVRLPRLHVFAVGVCVSDEIDNGLLKEPRETRVDWLIYGPGLGRIVLEEGLLVARLWDVGTLGGRKYLRGHGSYLYSKFCKMKNESYSVAQVIPMDARHGIERISEHRVVQSRGRFQRSFGKIVAVASKSNVLEQQLVTQTPQVGATGLLTLKKSETAVIFSLASVSGFIWYLFATYLKASFDIFGNNPWT